MTSDPTHEFLTPAARRRAGDDPIFALNALAQRRSRSGESILNATLGALMDDAGELVSLPSVTAALRRVDEKRMAAYAPIAGAPAFLAGVCEDVFGSTASRAAAVAVATPGGTGALHLAAVSFLEVGQSLLTSDFHWGPYETIAAHTGRALETFATFDARGRFHVDAFAAALERTLVKQGRALVFLNTPCHNPTGYSLDAAELEQVAQVVERLAGRGPICLLLDTAYERFGPRGGADWRAFLARLSASAQVLVAWSGSKAFTAYGSRVGALVALQADEARRGQLVGALSFACRGTWSNCNHAGMLALAEILSTPALRARVDAERAAALDLLSQRVDAFNLHATRAGLAFPRYEGGFFVTVFTPEPERCAQAMQAEGVFVVPIAKAVRVALCSTPVGAVERLVGALERGTRSLRPAARQGERA